MPRFCHSATRNGRGGPGPARSFPAGLAFLSAAVTLSSAGRPRNDLREGDALAPTQSSTVIYDGVRDRVWCVNQDNGSASVFDAKGRVRLREVPVGAHPRTLAQDSAGRIWVANQDDATLTLIDGDAFRVLRTLRLPRASRPFGICFDPRGGIAYVTLEGTGKLLRLDAATLETTGELSLFPSPRALAVGPDGARILATRFLSPADHGEAAEVDAAAFRLKRILALAYQGDPARMPGGIDGVPNALASVAISPDGRQAWIPFIKDNVRLGPYVNPAGPVPTFESTVRTGLTRLDLEAGAEIPGARIDFVNLSMADAAVCDHGGKFAYVSSSTGNAVSAFRADSGSLRLRFDPEDPARGAAPDGMALSPDDSLLFIHYLMDRAVGVYAVGNLAESDSVPRLALMPAVAEEALPPQVLAGKRIFHNAADPRMSLHRYISCAVCHLDGASDGRVWDVTHKGEGLRRTTSLLGKAGLGQGPLHWSANFDEIQDFEHDIRDAFSGDGFLENAEFRSGNRDQPLGGPKAGLSPGLDALAAYVSSLTRSRPSPYRNADGTLTADAEAGRAIFLGAGTGCAVCHPPPRYTDSGPAPGPGGSVPGGFLLHDVGTLNPGSGRRLGDTLTGFDTPTLLGVWEGGPYLHDGSAATLMDVITASNAGDRHGHTSQLTAREKEQLVAFLMQIEDGTEGTAVRPESGREGIGPSAGRWILRASGSGLRAQWNGPASPDEAEEARLAVYDLNGRLVARLRPAGYRPNGISTRNSARAAGSR